MSPAETDMIPRIVIRDELDQTVIANALLDSLNKTLNELTEMHRRREHRECKMLSALAGNILELLDIVEVDDNVMKQSARIAVMLTLAEMEG